MKFPDFFIPRLIFAITALGLLFSCQQPDLKEEHSLEIASPSAERIDVPGEGGEVLIEVLSNLQWQVSAACEDGSAAKWITFSQNKGTGDASVVATVARGIKSERTATVSVTSLDGKNEGSFKIVQDVYDGGSSDFEGYAFPAYDIFENVSDSDMSLGMKNASVEGAVLTFEKGATITMLGENASAAFETPNYYQLNVRFSGWDGDSQGIVMKIPVQEQLSGDFRMFWGWSGTSSVWDVAFSNDGENWNGIGSLAVASGNRFNRDVFFTVPESQAVPAGGSLYLKLTPQASLGADGYISFCSGFLLTRAVPDAAEPPAGDKILYYCDFNRVTEGCPYDMPLGYLRSSSVVFDPANFGYEGISKSGTVASEWGSVRIGSASGAASLVFPALGADKLGDGTADVKVSFDAVLYQAATVLSETQGKASCHIGVSVYEGDGTVEGGTITDLANWETFSGLSAVVKGASKSTRIAIGISGGSGDRRFYIDNVVIEAISEIEIPSEITKTLAEVLSLQDGTISESIKTEVTVVSDLKAGNVPDGVAAVTDGSSWASLKVTGAAELEEGKSVSISLKGASKSGAVLTVSPEQLAVTGDGSIPAAAVVEIGELAGNENRLVELRGVQAQTAFVGKTLSGDIAMENASGDSFTMAVLASADFAGSTVPEYSGTVSGLVFGGKLYPRRASDISLVLDRLGGAAAKGFSPIFCTYENSTETSGTVADVRNVTVNGLKAGFDTGAAIELVGASENASISFAQAKDAFYNVYLTSSGWDTENAHYRLSCPVSEEISGKVAVTFSLNGKTEVLQQWNIFWSADGENWTATDYTWNTKNNTEELALAAKNTFTAQSTTAAGITRTEFTVPASGKIPAGGTLYIKLAPSKAITKASIAVQLGMGFVVSGADVENTTAPSDALVFNNFSECTAGTDYMLGAGLRYLANVATPAYSRSGWTVANGFCRTGYTMYGTASSGDHGITAPALSALSETRDVTVTFKCCLYMPSNFKGAKDDICVKVAEGSGAAGEIVWDSEPESDYYGWHTGTVTISGASADTRIFIGAGAGKAAGDRRFFLDDIYIK